MRCVPGDACYGSIAPVYSVCSRRAPHRDGYRLVRRGGPPSGDEWPVARFGRVWTAGSSRFFRCPGCFAERSSRGTSDSSTNPRRSSTSTDSAKTHAGFPDGDSISMRSPAHTISPMGTPSRTCWCGEGIGSASAVGMVPDAMDMATTSPNIVIFCIMGIDGRYQLKDRKLVLGEGSKISRICWVDSETRLGQLAAEKYGTVSAGLMRQYDTHLEKTRKSLPAVAPPPGGPRFQGRPSGRLANSGQSPLRQRRRGVTPTASLDTGTCRRPASMVFGTKITSGLEEIRQSCPSGLHQIWRLFTKLYSAVYEAYIDPSI